MGLSVCVTRKASEKKTVEVCGCSAESERVQGYLVPGERARTMREALFISVDLWLNLKTFEPKDSCSRKPIPFFIPFFMFIFR